VNTVYDLIRSKGSAWRKANRPGTITINGVPYACAVGTTPATTEWDSTLMVEKHIETLRIDLSKTLLATCPNEKTEILYNGKRFILASAGGQQSSAPDWVLHCKRNV